MRRVVPLLVCYRDFGAGEQRSQGDRVAIGLGFPRRPGRTWPGRWCAARVVAEELLGDSQMLSEIIDELLISAQLSAIRSGLTSSMSVTSSPTR